MTLDPDVNDRKFEFRSGPYGGHYRHLTGPAGVGLATHKQNSRWLPGGHIENVTKHKKSVNRQMVNQTDPGSLLVYSEDHPQNEDLQHFEDRPWVVRCTESLHGI
jgi:hypothetical protein